MEIEFFGVTGTSFEDSTASNTNESEININDMSLSGLLSDYELELRVLNDTKVLKTLTNIEINQLTGLDMPFSGKTLMKNATSLNHILLTGKT